MRIIFKIARAELRTLFYSPIAWITIVVFFVISGSLFTSPLMNMAVKQELQVLNNPNWEGFLPGPLTINLFMASIETMLRYLFLFIPLLTMDTINREVNAGTMKLLNASPVRIREIVMGKFLGLTGFNLALLSSIALLLFTGYFTIQHAEFAWYCSILLGFFLLTNTYMAIGLFISTITNYQIVAGIATFMVFIALGMVGGMLQEYDFVRDVTWFLSLSGRGEQLMSGLITTRELFYFILVTMLFLGLTMLKLKSRQESKKWTVSLWRYLVLIVVVLTLGYFSSRPGAVGYYDVTNQKLNTIDTATQNVLKELDGSPITVTLYTNLLGRNVTFGLPVTRNAYIWGFWEQYLRFYPNINFKYEYYYDTHKEDSSLVKAFPNKNIHQIGKQFARIFGVDLTDFKKPGEIDSLIDLSREDELKLLMELEYKGKKSLMRTVEGGPFPKQFNVSASIRKLTRDNFPKVLFTTGHYERSPWRNGDREYGGITNNQGEKESMTNNGMEADTISVLNNDIPANTKLLVIADPRSALEAIEQQKILQYIEKGGNAIIYGEPGKQHILNPLLNKMGVQLDPGILVNPASHRRADVFTAFLNKTGTSLARPPAIQDALHMFGGIRPTSFITTCNISYKDTNGFRVEPIYEFAVEKGAWMENGIFVSDSAQPTFASAEGDYQKPGYTLGVKLTRMVNNKEQRLVVLSDADLSAGHPHGIALGLYSWLVYNEYPVYINNIYHKDIRLNIGKQPAKILYYTYVYVLPGLLLLTGTIILIRRKRK